MATPTFEFHNWHASVRRCFWDLLIFQSSLLNLRADPISTCENRRTKQPKMFSVYFGGIHSREQPTGQPASPHYHQQCRTGEVWIPCQLTSIFNKRFQLFTFLWSPRIHFYIELHLQNSILKNGVAFFWRITWISNYPQISLAIPTKSRKAI